MALAWADVRAAVVGLGVPLDDLVVMGSAPLLACGALSSVGDVDVVARGEAWAQLAARGSVVSGALGDAMVDLPGGIQVFSGWHGQPADAVVASSTWVDGVRVGSVDAVVAYKRRLARPKDLEHLEAYERWLTRASS
ncbi:hypothetical protein [Demequina sp. NBRC 110055]|uniref:hypothetical protein n=1 Tax=Demequina sp. NBRC 110055 TaxID=1570344 RepID=UPI0009FF70E9|nr:hypothetical protein [Demequina sp. NBRC 110055]